MTINKKITEDWYYESNIFGSNRPSKNMGSSNTQIFNVNNQNYFKSNEQVRFILNNSGKLFTGSIQELHAL